MATSSASPGRLPARIEPRLLGTAAVGGLLGGLLLFFVMAGYNASTGMGFWTILNVCFAAWVFRGTAMTSSMPGHQAMPGHAMASPMPEHSAMTGHTATGQGMGGAAMMNQPLLASHVIVGGLLHLAMSAFAAIAFAVVLTLLTRAGVRALATPAGYVIGAIAGGALFFLSHLLYGATIGAWVVWKLGYAGAGLRLHTHRPRLGGAT